MYVVVVVLDRLMDGFADSFEAGKVNHGINAFESGRHGNLVTNVAFNKSRTAAGDGFQAVEHGTVGVGEIVKEHDVVAGFQQNDGGMRADKAHAAREKNFHTE